MFSLSEIFTSVFFPDVSSSGNGTIDFEEFVGMMAKKLKEMDNENEMKDAFG